jgi:hypothetical protein
MVRPLPMGCSQGNIPDGEEFCSHFLRKKVVVIRNIFVGYTETIWQETNCNLWNETSLGLCEENFQIKKILVVVWGRL